MTATNLPTAEAAPPDSHTLSFHASPSEAAGTVAAFLKGAAECSQPGIVFTSREEMLRRYQAEVHRIAPELEVAFRQLAGPHVHETSDGLRPPDEVMALAAAHPTGVSMCGDTLSQFLSEQNLPEVLAYETWYESLRPFPHRGLCPYDLSSLPTRDLDRTLTQLVGAHSHVVLSHDPRPHVQLVQMLVTPLVRDPPPGSWEVLERAMDQGLIEWSGRGPATVGLTIQGVRFAEVLRGIALRSVPADSPSS
ncbi:MAG: MEDS domain-containing protein [Thermoplasmata archaeon]|nr:MEDS domain-containing protein [Thermoplasmata archaeon]